jgi:hypothetical protein
MTSRTIPFLALAVLCVLLPGRDAAAESGTRSTGAIEDDIDAIRKALAKGAEGGSAPPASVTPDLTGCVGRSPSGKMSLLGVTSDMGPSTQGVSPVTKLGRDHPAMKPLSELAVRMGMTQESSAQARQQKALHDTYAFFVEAAGSGTTLGGPKGTPIAELFGWVYEGKMEEMAKAYASYEVLARQYASLYQAAESAGRACP